jgi:hypothetical protein
LPRGQLDMPRTVQGQHETTADHIPRMPVGLYPVPGFAKLDRQGTPAESGMSRHQLPDEAYILVGDHPPPVSQFLAHGPQDNRPATGTQAPP